MYRKDMHRTRYLCGSLASVLVYSLSSHEVSYPCLRLCCSVCSCTLVLICRILSMLVLMCRMVAFVKVSMVSFVKVNIVCVGVHVSYGVIC